MDGRWIRGAVLLGALASGLAPVVSCASASSAPHEGPASSATRIDQSCTEDVQRVAPWQPHLEVFGVDVNAATGTGAIPVPLAGVVAATRTTRPKNGGNASHPAAMDGMGPGFTLNVNRSIDALPDGTFAFRADSDYVVYDATGASRLPRDRATIQRGDDGTLVRTLPNGVKEIYALAPQPQVCTPVTCGGGS